MRYIILLAGVLITVTVVHGGIYQWTDRDGGVHFTDNQDKIPPDSRNRAREVDVTPSIQIREQSAESPPPATPPAAPAFGGHNEMWWRSRFSSLHDNIKKIQDGLPEKKEKLAELRRMRTLYTRSRDRVIYNQVEGEIKRDEEQVMNLEKRLAELDAEAARAGVPLDWRR